MEIEKVIIDREKLEQLEAENASMKKIIEDRTYKISLHRNYSFPSSFYYYIDMLLCPLDIDFNEFSEDTLKEAVKMLKEEIEEIKKDQNSTIKQVNDKFNEDMEYMRVVYEDILKFAMHVMNVADSHNRRFLARKVNLEEIERLLEKLRNMTFAKRHFI